MIIARRTTQAQRKEVALGIRSIPDGFANDGNRELHPFSGIGAGSGSKDVWEWYSEINVPIWQSESGQSIGSSFAYRSSDYSLSGRQESWKIGLDAQVLESLRWRITKSSDIREPNFAETFLTGTGGGAVVDPFRNNENSNGLTVLATSNPTLSAEIADTITTGFVWQPTFAGWIDGLSVSLDWYEINLKDAITPYGPQRIVDDCFATRAASACDLLKRLPTSDGSLGPLSRILNQNINAAMAQTRGVDFEAGYRFEPDFFSGQSETLSVRALMGYLAENSTTTAAGAVQDAAQSQTRPEFSGIVTGTYTLGAWGLMLQSRYYDSVMNNNLWIEGREIDDNWIASQTTFNTAVSYDGETKSGSTWRASFNITNLFDREPPIVAGANGQSIIPSHDILGRRYQFSLNMEF